MRFLDEHRRRPAALADHLPWAALVAPGVVLNKDGAFTTGFRFRGPDLESASETELMAVRARLNNALRRLGDGWCLHVEASRRSAATYPESAFSIDVAWLADAERREGFQSADPAFETGCRRGTRRAAWNAGCSTACRARGRTGARRSPSSSGRSRRPLIFSRAPCPRSNGWTTRGF